MALLQRRTDQVFTAPVDDTALVLNTETGLYHGLNPVASRIWDLLATPIEADELVALLVAEFDVTPSVCGVELDSFLAGLRERGLLIAG